MAAVGDVVALAEVVVVLVPAFGELEGRLVEEIVYVVCDVPTGVPVLTPVVDPLSTRKSVHKYG